MSTWTARPSPEALARDARARARQSIGRGVRGALLAAALWGITAKSDMGPWATLGADLGALSGYGVLWAVGVRMG
jgi:hypothetical protein